LLEIDLRLGRLDLDLRLLWLGHLDVGRRLIDLDLWLRQSHVDLGLRHANDDFGSWDFNSNRWRRLPLLGYVAGGESSLRTRNGKDWTESFPAIAAAVKKLKADDAVLDMEAVILDHEGKSGFQALQAALGDGGRPERIIAYVFDLLHLREPDQTSTDRAEISRLASSRKPSSLISSWAESLGHDDITRLLRGQGCHRSRCTIVPQIVQEDVPGLLRDKTRPSRIAPLSAEKKLAIIEKTAMKTTKSRQFLVEDLAN
jgi:hypothetical protein